MHELNLSYPNYEPEPRHQFRIVSFTQNGDEYIPQLVGGVLTGVKVGAPNQVIGGPTLAGARFIVTSDLTHTKYDLQIESIGHVAYWAQTNGAQTPYYTISWKTVDAGETAWKNICKAPPKTTDLETLGMETTSAVLFEGDRLDVTSKSVVGMDKMWMNIGCAGHAVSKLHMTAHSQAAQVATGMMTTREERTAMLKMFVADYCGDGRAFTVAGQPLSWVDDHHWLSLWPGWNYEIEARWTEKGATCLNTPRVLQNPSPEADALFKDVKTAISDECGGQLPPPCDGTFNDFDKAHMISANPLL
ncbi:MAG TPA: ADYC domain-containing protein [Kofleriaceae bacterium]|nr:ADYC domain-containing protein [Kofleriaceae bacterium]